MPQQINIGVDIRNLRVAETGTKTTLEEICRQFRHLENEYCRFYFFDTKYTVYAGTNKWKLALGHLRLQLWKQVVLPVKAWRKKCDIVFCDDYFAPYIHLGFTTVQVFHDAFFFEYPEHYNGIWLKIFKYFALPAAKRSSFIMVPTNYARQTVHKHAHIALDKLVAIYEGPKSLPAPGALVQFPSEWHKLDNCPYILHVGVLDKRKNLPRLIQAFHQLRALGYDRFKLVLAGKGSGKIHSDETELINRTIEQYQLQQHVIQTGYVPDETLAAIYAGAFMYVFPSVNEGFGIPVLEAFRFKIPVLVANNTCLPEVGGDAVLSFNPFEPSDICDKMRLLIDNEALRKELIARGEKRMGLFSWEKTAAQLMELFKKAQNREKL